MPKAVMLSHDNLVFEATTVLRMLKHMVGVEYECDSMISYLPLSHIAGFVSRAGNGESLLIEQRLPTFREKGSSYFEFRRHVLCYA